MLASSKVRTSRITAQAARKRETANTAPEPSPSRISSSSRGLSPRAASTKPWAGSALRWAASKKGKSEGLRRTATRAAAPVMKPSSNTGTPRSAAASMAPTSAAISKPPRRARSSEGSCPHVQCERVADHGVLALKPGIVDPGSASRHGLGGEAEQCRHEGRSAGAVADPHLPQQEHVELRKVAHYLCASGHCCFALEPRHGRLTPQVAGASPYLALNEPVGRPEIVIDSHVHHVHGHLFSACKGIHHRAACQIAVDHLDGGLALVCADPFRRHPVVTREQRQVHVLAARIRGVLHGGELQRQLLEHAQTSARLREVGVALQGCRGNLQAGVGRSLGTGLGRSAAGIARAGLPQASSYTSPSSGKRLDQPTSANIGFFANSTG